jgi:hypothetical protein
MQNGIDAQFASLTPSGLGGWCMAGGGGFRWVDGVLESGGGPGVFWYKPMIVSDFILRCAWRTRSRTDNSGVFLRIPALNGDITPALDEGFEVEIDDRGYNPVTGREDSAIHASGAIYGLTPALAAASHPPGEWNEFEITARGRTIAVRLNGSAVSHCGVAMRRAYGHIGLQSHHDGSHVQFRDLRLCKLPS